MQVGQTADSVRGMRSRPKDIVFWMDPHLELPHKHHQAFRARLLPAVTGPTLSWLISQHNTQVAKPTSSSADLSLTLQGCMDLILQPLTCDFFLVTQDL